MSTHAEMFQKQVESLDLREKGANDQTTEKRLFVQLQCFENCMDTSSIIRKLNQLNIPSVLYANVNNPTGIGILFLTEDPSFFVNEGRTYCQELLKNGLLHQDKMTMIGRTYSAGREQDLEDWLISKPIRNALNPEFPWAVWYPLRRKSSFELLPKEEQNKMLLEHGLIGMAYGKKGYAHDIRLACHGLDENDNEFVLGIVSPELYILSKLVQHMRKTQQTGNYMASLGPFFVGKVLWQATVK